MTVLYRQINSPDDVTYLQDDLTKTIEWCDVWQMQVNTETFKHVTFFHVTFFMISGSPKNAYV